MANWQRGIPSYSLGQRFTYFLDLNANTGSPAAQPARQQLFEAAQADVARGISEVNNFNLEKIEKATQFMRKVANNERQKELNAISTFCKQIKDFPILANKDLNEAEMLKDPFNYYIKMIKYLNEAKKSSEDYKKELRRIQKNISTETKKTGREQYSEDNITYNLYNDLKSAFNKMIGTYRARKDSATSMTSKVQSAMVDVMSELGVAQQLAQGTEFVSVGFAVLTDLQKQLQDVYDEKYADKSTRQKPIKLEDIVDKELPKILDRYIKEAKEQKGSSVQRNLADLSSREAQIMIQNGINMFGISYLEEDSDDLKKRLDKIEENEERLKYTRKDYKEVISKVHNMAAGNQTLEALVPRVKITNFNVKTVHGNMAEYITSLLTTDAKNTSIKIRKNAAADVMTYTATAELEEADQKEIDIFMDNIIETINSSVNDANFKEGEAQWSDRKKLTERSNKLIEQLSHQIDEKIREIDELTKFFIFHESIKLYSSIETGKSKAFSGRTLNIISAIEKLYSEVGDIVGTPADEELLIMMGLNLSPQAVGSQAKDPLSKYFSIFAGLLMFDDIDNMAKEAVETTEYSNLNHIHLYKINNIYMPASLVLTQLSDTIELAAAEAINGAAASASISTNGATMAINKWLKNRRYDDSKNGHYKNSDWPNVASKVTSGTKIHIIFLASFLNLINELAK